MSISDKLIEGYLGYRLASYKRGTRYSRAGGTESVHKVNAVHELTGICTSVQRLSIKGLYWDIRSTLLEPRDARSL